MSDDLTKQLPNDDGRDDFAARVERRLDLLISMVEAQGADLRKLENRFDNLEKRFDNLEKRFDNLENRFENRFENLENRFESLENRFENLENRIEKLEKTVEERLYDTRPLWERALAEIADLRSGLAEVRAGLAELQAEVREGFYNFGTRIELLLRDVFSLRTDHERLSRRVDEISPKAS
ncbi:MAG TPA: hypothetical protein VLD57_03850 [Blastocatellia bacterium]|nr:hypothetical protein [Blastocatellia bacterium]